MARRRRICDWSCKSRWTVCAEICFAVTAIASAKVGFAICWTTERSTPTPIIYIVQEPYWFLYEKGPIVVMHGAPWRYDTYVPIIFAGADIEPQTVNRLVHPMDIAPTLSIYLGTKPPSSAEGQPLEEVLP